MSKLGTQSHFRPKRTLTPVTVSGTAASSAAVAAGINVVRIVSTTDCHYVIDGTATTNDAYLPAEAVEYISIYEGEQVSFIQNAAGGTAYVTEMTQ